MPETALSVTTDTHFGPFLFQTHAAALAARLEAAYPPCVVVDVRPAAAFASGRIAGSVRLAELPAGALPPELTQAAEVFVIGAGPADANRRRVALALRARGLSRVVEVPGGIAEWERRGLPLARG
ncbi:MAG: rhodanese-like domain-containing protein [Acidobacteria bacterium]|nr:rhodanese-like domain-containing protein [Thermoanaerobaculia bacterium]NLN10791.1 rhodanese-like domain-containing protein [Acidobacteriota bacterium]MBP7813769.1 rhodanese-like domain-containing protein [Thermoanaerobaculia bacterium]HNZ96960.1 rhodanese-like domain-containing protein [Thermoanaerobaculia bacterium]HPA96719.1 rhodanese-like domain-containing protein [Thermoanaerobaculia bacterium]